MGWSSGSVVIADVIPLLTGTMIFVSVLLAGRRTERSRRLAWALGLLSQLLLIAFGLLTRHVAFGTHALVAGAFAWNLWTTRKREVSE